MNKKYILLLILLFSCTQGLTEEETAVQDTIATTEENTTTTTSLSISNNFKTLSKYGWVLEEINKEYCISLPSFKSEPLKCFDDEKEALDDWEFRINLEEYRQGWVAQLISYPKLTTDEYTKSIQFTESIKPGSSINLKIEGKDYSCKDKDSGTVVNMFANEIHPVEYYKEGEDSASNLGYTVSLDFNCIQISGESAYALYGPLFYQDNKWWGFKESYNDYWHNYPKDIEILAFMTQFAERVTLVVLENK